MLFSSDKTNSLVCGLKAQGFQPLTQDIQDKFTYMHYNLKI